MKLKELINRVDKSKQFEDEVSIYEIGEKEFNLYNLDYNIIQDKLISFWLGNWYCTDSYVGYKVYFFDNKPVAVSSQTGRKMDEKIEWLSKESYKLVKEYVLTFLIEQEDESFKLVDLEEEVSEGYKIKFNSQLFDYHKTKVKYYDNDVKIIKLAKDPNKYGIDQDVLIQFEDKTEKWINIKELVFKYNIV